MMLVKCICGENTMVEIGSVVPCENCGRLLDENGNVIESVGLYFGNLLDDLEFEGTINRAEQDERGEFLYDEV